MRKVKKTINKMLILIIAFIIVGMIPTNAKMIEIYTIPTLNIKEKIQSNIPQYIRIMHLKGGNWNKNTYISIIEEQALTIYTSLRNQGIVMSKDEIYEKIINVDKNNQRFFASDLKIRIEKNLQEILEWRRKIDRREEAKVIYQNPEMPNGCEITSGTILLNWIGYNVDKMTMHNDYLPKYPVQNGVMPDPNEYYIGDARKNYLGWYCFEQPVIDACNQYLEDVGSSQRVKQVSGLSQEEMDKYLGWNIPLVIWMTTDYKTPRYSNYTYKLTNGESYTPYTNLHCVVVTSKNDDGSYNIADPIIGWKTISEETFWYVFTQMGSRAITVDCDGLIL